MIDWMKEIEEFSDIDEKAIVDMDTENTGTPNVTIQASWTYIDEGYGGYFDSEDPDDAPLLRFYVSKLSIDTQEFSDIDDGSYCTLMPINTPKEVLKRAARHILNTVSHNVAVGSFYKRDLEGLSWMEPAWFEKEKP